MTKIKELLAGRDKLAKYDELTEWKQKFEDNKVFTPQRCNEDINGCLFTLMPKPLPKSIKQIIVSALDAEIKKLDEE